MKGNIFIITGPSGVGKTTVAMELLKRRPQLKKVVTCTTRSPREGEVNGVSYHFLGKETFQQLIDHDELFEWDEHYGNFYGSRRSDVRALIDSGNDVLFVIDVEGAKTIQQEHPDTRVIFIDAESDDVLMKRLTARDQGKTVNLEERLRAIQNERSYGATCEYRVVNQEGNLEKTVQEVLGIMEHLDEKS
ncbi:guanylate kinase [Candidatus Uhrbacteria bacterium]|nr:guanylate kinase [Candidatus Uhrbacteria bacterium]